MFLSLANGCDVLGTQSGLNDFPVAPFVFPLKNNGQSEQVECSGRSVWGFFLSQIFLLTACFAVGANEGGFCGST